MCSHDMYGVLCVLYPCTLCVISVCVLGLIILSTTKYIFYIFLMTCMVCCVYSIIFCTAQHCVYGVCVLGQIILQCLQRQAMQISPRYMWSL